jgi:predicted site-specific integrase-resolvase
MTLPQIELAKRLGVSNLTLARWRKKGYFGEVTLAKRPYAYHYDLAAVKEAVLRHKLRVAANAFDDLEETK